MFLPAVVPARTTREKLDETRQKHQLIKTQTDGPRPRLIREKLDETGHKRQLVKTQTDGR